MGQSALLFLLLWGAPSHDLALLRSQAPPIAMAATPSADKACSSDGAGCFYRFCAPYTPWSGCIQCPGKTNCCKRKISPKPKPPTT